MIIIRIRDINVRWNYFGRASFKAAIGLLIGQETTLFQKNLYFFRVIFSFCKVASIHLNRSYDIEYHRHGREVRNMTHTRNHKTSSIFRGKKNSCTSWVILLVLSSIFFQKHRRKHLIKTHLVIMMINIQNEFCDHTHQICGEGEV